MQERILTCVHTKHYDIKQFIFLAFSISNMKLKFAYGDNTSSTVFRCNIVYHGFSFLNEQSYMIEKEEAEGKSLKDVESTMTLK